MTKISKIKVLKNLPYALCKDKNLRKAIETFLFLKHYHPNGTIWNFSSRAGEMAEECNISIRTLWTRLGTLTENKLISKRNGILSLASWDQVMAIFKIKQKNFYFTRTEKYNSKRRLEYFLETKAFQEKRVEMKNAFNREFKSSRELRQTIVSNVGVSEPEKVIEALFDLQLHNFRKRISTEDSDYLNLLNPDFNLNVASLAFLFDSRESKSSGTYTKSKLLYYGFVRIEKRQLESANRARSCTLGTVFYCREKKQTVLQLPDNIIIL